MKRKIVRWQRARRSCGPDYKCHGTGSLLGPSNDGDGGIGFDGSMIEIGVKCFTIQMRHNGRCAEDEHN